MFVWENIKNPNEVKRYTFSWAGELASGDTIASCSAELVAGATGGLTIDQSNQFSGTDSYVKLSGGSAGETALVQGTVITTGGETFVDVGQLTIAEAYTVPPSSLADLQADLMSLRAARITLLQGGQIKEVTREGRRIVYAVPTVESLNAAIKEYERLIDEATAVETGTRSRFRALKPRFN